MAGFSLMNGLSSMGQSLSQTAGQMGLLTEKMDLERQGQILANDLATQRETGLEGLRQQGTLAQTQLSNQLATQRETALENLRNVAALQRSREEQASATQRTQMTVEAEPSEVRLAKWLSDPATTDAQRNAYYQAAMSKDPTAMMLFGNQMPGMPGTTAPPSAPAPTPAPTPVTPSKIQPDTTIAPGVPAKPQASTAPVTAPAVASTPREILPGDSSVDTSQYNMDALKKYSPAVQNLVLRMVEGREKPLQGAAARNPSVMALKTIAAEVDPNFDDTTWEGRYRTRMDFTGGGKDAQSLMVLNNAMHHAGNLVKHFGDLDNTNLPILGMLNAPINYLEQEVLKDPRQGPVLQDIEAISGEMRKLVGGGSLQELNDWKKGFSLGMSPKQFQAQMDGLMDIIAPRIQGLADNYNRGMQRSIEPMALMNDEARRVWSNIKGTEAPVSTGYQLGQPPRPMMPQRPGVPRATVTIPPPPPGFTVIQ
jgi:hypothetical protein